MQQGSVIQTSRKEGPSVWQFRWPEKDLNVLARCIGHGAFPVSGTTPYAAPNAGVPLEPINLDLDPTNFYRHGYVLMQLDGPSADVSYLQVDAETGEENCLFHEVFPSAQGAE
jgi:hypothetical protein